MILEPPVYGPVNSGSSLAVSRRVPHFTDSLTILLAASICRHQGSPRFSPAVFFVLAAVIQDGWQPLACANKSLLLCPRPDKVQLSPQEAVAREARMATQQTATVRPVLHAKDRVLVWYLPSVLLSSRALNRSLPFLDFAGR